MYLALLIWVFTIIFSLVIGTFLCYLIEKSCVERWGATGRIFQYDKKEEG